MFRRLLLGLGLGILLSATLVAVVPYFRTAFLGWLHNEPFAQGMPASYWVAALAHDPKEEVRRQAAQALAEIGPEIIPQVISALKARGCRLSPQANAFFLQMGPQAVPPLADEIQSEDSNFRREAMRLLGKLGPRAREAVPALTRALRDSNAEVRRGAARVLARIGRPAAAAVPALGTALADRDGSVRRQAAAALAAIGPKARRVLPALIKALADPQVEVRRLAALAVGSIGAEARKAVPALTTALKDKSALVREQAARALGRVGPDAAQALPELIRLLNGDPHLHTRKEAAMALGRLGPKAHEAVPDLLEAAFSRYLDLGNPAADALVRVGARADELFPLWLAAFREGKQSARIAPQRTKLLLDRRLLDPKTVKEALFGMITRADPQLVRRASLTLVHLDPVAAEAAPAYRDALASADPQTIRRTSARLTSFGTRAVPVLRVLLRDESPTVRGQAAYIIGQIGFPTSQTIAALTARFADREYSVWVQAEAALGRISPYHGEPIINVILNLRKPPEKGDNRCRSLYQLTCYGGSAAGAVREVIEALHDTDRATRVVAAYALCRLGLMERQTYLPYLMKALKDTDPEVRALALKGVNLSSPPAVAPADVLVLLQDKDKDVRYQAAVALSGMYQPPPREALPTLLAMLKEGDPTLSKQIIPLLGRFGPQARAAMRPLVATVKHRDPWLRRIAILALANIGPADQEVVRILADRLKSDGDAVVRAVAVSALGQMGAGARAAEPALREALHDSADGIRLEAASALWRVSGRAEEAIKTLLTILQARPASPNRGNAAQGLANMGAAARTPAVLAALTGAVADNDPQWYPRYQILAALAQMGPATRASAEAVLKRLTTDQVSNIRTQAMQVIGRYGPADREAVGPLIEALSQPWNQPFPQQPMAFPQQPPLQLDRAPQQQAIIAALGNIGPAASRAVDPLKTFLTNTIPQTRVVAATALGKIGPAARSALPNLEGTLNDLDLHVRLEAALAIHRVDPSSAKPLAALRDLLSRSAPGLRSQVVAALGNLGPLARAAVPDLIEKFKADPRNGAVPTDYLQVCYQARLALQKIDPRAELVLPALIPLLTHASATTRLQAAVFLTGLGRAARTAVPDLTALLKDRDYRVRVAAAEALWKVDNNTAGVAVLIEGVKSTDPYSRRDCSFALSRMGPVAAPATSALVALLKDQSPTIREAGCIALGMIGPGARESVPALGQALSKDLAGYVRIAAASALGRIGPGAKGVVADLVAALRQSDVNLRLAVAEALWRIDRRTRETVPVLMELVKKRTDYTRYRAALALGMMGPAAREAIPVLEQGLADGQTPWANLTLAESLWRIAEKPGKGGPILLGGLKDKYSYTRLHSVQALGRIGPAARIAIPALQALRQDPDESVRKAAAAALQKIDAAVKKKE